MPPVFLICLAAVTQSPVSYSREVADVLLAKCAGCHNAAERSGKLSLESVADMRSGGKRGPALVAGHADQSRMYRLAARLDKPAMPPPDKPQAVPLTKAELDLLRRWIDEGAVDDSSDAEPAGNHTVGALPASYAPIMAVDIGDDGRRVAAGHGDRVELFDCDTGLRLHTFTGLRDLVQSVRISPDGRWLAAGAYGDVMVWTCPTLLEGKPLVGHKGVVSNACVLNSGATIASTSADKTLRLWDLSKASVAQVVDLPAEGCAVAVRPGDGLFAVACGDGAVRLLDRDRRPRASVGLIAGRPRRVQFRGELLVGVSDQGCRVWSVPAVPELATAILYDIPDAAGTFELYDREGNALLVVARADGTLAIHDLKTGARQRTIAVDDAEKPAAIRSLLSDPARGAVWAGLADGRIMGVDIEAGTMLESLALHKSAISALALSPQGDRLLSADEAGAIVCWDVASREPLAAFAHPALKRGDPALAVTAVVPLDDTRFVTASAQGDLRQWTIEGRWGEWKRLEGHAERVLALDFNPSGTLLAVGAGHTNRDGEVTIWETGKGMLVRRLANAHSDSVYGVRFSPDGTRLATASADKFVKVFDVSDGREWRSLEGHTNHVLSVDWSADGRQLVSGGADNVIKFWDPEAGESTRSSQPLDKQITNLRWPRGAGTPVVAAACGDRNVRFLNPGNTQVTRMFQGPQTFVYAVALSPDRTRVAAGDADGVLHIWNGNNAQVLHKIGPDR